MKPTLYLLILSAILSLMSCGSEEDNPTLSEVKIRLVEEPDRLNPMLSQSSVATQIENYIFLPLMEFDPLELDFVPVLATGAPSISDFRDGKRFDFEIREDAQWHDGQPVTAEDYLFTIKAAVNPHSGANAWRGFLSEIDSVEVSPDDPKKFSVFVDNAFHLALETVANFSIYPKHHYDPSGDLDDYTLPQLRADSLGGKAEDFGQAFQDIKYSRDSILGCGPYTLTQWVPNLKIELEKVEGYTLDHPKANPDKLTYLIVPDEATSITMLQGGKLDVMSGVSPTIFKDLKEGQNDLAFHTPSIMQYYYLALNNTDAALKDIKVRQAIAHSLDLPKLSDVLMAGLAQPIAGPVHPSKPHYNKDLEVIPYDPERAKALLDEAGWKDANGDGIREKNVDGQTEELKLDILVTQRELGRNLARILKENTKPLGIEINIVTLEWGQIVERMGSRNFDIIAMATRQSPGLDDFYQSWHTESIGAGGRNIPGFGNATSDSLIQAIRTEEDPAARTQLYYQMQEEIYKAQPVVFLFAPTATIIHSKDLEMDISSRRPGYFEGSAVRK
jgi:peptide/nickel transport system substrate-binding protein